MAAAAFGPDGTGGQKGRTGPPQRTQLGQRNLFRHAPRSRPVLYRAEAVAAGELFIDALPEHEFAIVGSLVADAAITAVEHTALPEPKLVVTAELLLLEEV